MVPGNDEMENFMDYLWQHSDQVINEHEDLKRKEAAKLQREQEKIQQEMERVQREKVERERQEQAERDRQLREQQEIAERERMRQEQERREQEKIQQARIERERMEQEKLQRERETQEKQAELLNQMKTYQQFFGQFGNSIDQNSMIMLALLCSVDALSQRVEKLEKAISEAEESKEARVLEMRRTIDNLTATLVNFENDLNETITDKARFDADARFDTKSGLREIHLDIEAVERQVAQLNTSLGEAFKNANMAAIMYGPKPKV